MIYTIQSSENNGVVNPIFEFAKESNDLKKNLVNNYISDKFLDLVRAIPDLDESKVRVSIDRASGLLPSLYRIWKRNRTFKKVIESYSKIESYLFEEFIKDDERYML